MFTLYKNGYNEKPFDISTKASYKRIQRYLRDHLSQSPQIKFFIRSLLLCSMVSSLCSILLDFYNKVNKDKKQIEIIFISHDEEEKEFDEYYKDMPWAAVPYDFDDREDISESFNIIGVPTFVVVNSKGKLVDAKGKVTILNDGIKAIDKWGGKK